MRIIFQRRGDFVWLGPVYSSLNKLGQNRVGDCDETDLLHGRADWFSWESETGWAEWLGMSWTTTRLYMRGSGTHPIRLGSLSVFKTAVVPFYPT